MEANRYNIIVNNNIFYLVHDNRGVPNMSLDSKNKKGLMVEFVRKPKPVFAIQFNGYNVKEFEEILGWKVDVFDYGGPTFDATGTGGNYISKGKWMVVNPRKSKQSLDRIRTMEDWEFQKQYMRK